MLRKHRIRPAVEALEQRELLTAGALDPTFDGNGKMDVNFAAGSDDWVGQSAMQSDGKVVVAGHTDGTASGRRAFALARVTLDGSLDTAGFGGGDGRVITDFGFDAWAHAVAIQPGDGKILVAGRVFLTGSDLAFGVARYHANGTPDTSFGSAATPGRIILNPTPNADVPVGIAVRRDGRIIVGGKIRGGPATNETFGAARLFANGTLDTSFGVNGYAGLNFTVNAGLPGYAVEATDLKLDANDNILVCGSHFADTSGAHSYLDVILARFEADGSGLDQSFNAGGVQRGVAQVDAWPGRRDHTGRMAVQDDGKIVVSATSLSTQNDSGISLIRFHPNGLLDTSFASGGKAQIQPPAAHVVSGLSQTGVETQGVAGPANTLRIVVTATRASGNERDAFVARFMNNGALDSAFSDDGMQWTDLDNGSDDSAADVLIRGDGKVSVVGTYHKPGSTTADFFVTRYEDDSLTFGAPQYSVGENDGFATIPVHRIRGTTGTVTVQVSHSLFGTATVGADYAPVTQTLTFGPGVTFRTFRVFVHRDAAAEGVETVGLLLSNADGASLGPNRFTTLEIQNVTVPASTVVRPRGIVAFLAKVKRKGRTRTYVRVSWADTGELKEEMPCPFQSPQYRGVACRTLDADGDGVDDTAAVSGRRGKKLLTRLYRLA